MPFGFDPSLVLPRGQYTGPDPGDTMRTLADLALRHVQQQQGEASLASLQEEQGQRRAFADILRQNSENPNAVGPAAMRAGLAGPALDWMGKQAEIDTRRASAQNALQEMFKKRADLLARPLRGGLKTQDDLDNAWSSWKASGLSDVELAGIPKEFNEQTAPLFKRISDLGLSNEDAERTRHNQIDETEHNRHNLIEEKKPPASILVPGATGFFGWDPRHPSAPATPVIGPDKAQITKPGEGGGDALTPEAVDQAAQAFLLTGKLPQLGMGKNSMAARTKIINRAAEMGKGDWAGNKADYEANVKSLGHLRTQADAVNAFESTALANLDLFLKSSEGVVDHGSPLFNAGARQFANSVSGDPKMAEFIAARNAAVSEVSKVLSGQTGGGAVSDSARHEAADLLSKDASLAQIQSAARVLKKDMENRRTSFDRQIAEVQGRLRPKSASTPAVGAAVGPRGATTVQNGHTYTWNATTGAYE